MTSFQVADGDGSGYGSGSGYGETVGQCGNYEVTYVEQWSVLRIGCEVRTLKDWIDNADAIDARHGDGIADQTRALALSLMPGGDR